MMRWRLCTPAAMTLISLGAAPAALAAAVDAAAPGHRTQALDYRVHDEGATRCVITNWGQVGARPGSSGATAGEPSLEWPPGSGVEYLWAAGFWLGAIVNGEPRVTTTQYSTEVRPGVTGLDRIYASYEGAPRGARHPSPDADDDGDGRFDEDRLNGRDDDLDGEIDEDFAAVSDQMFACEYNDIDPAIVAANPLHVPLGARFEQSTFAWNDPRIDGLIGLRVRVTNTSIAAWDDVHAGLFADPDIGLREAEQIAADDRAGFWEGDVEVELGGPTRMVRVGFPYAFDTDGDEGQASGYVGVVFLGARHRDGTPVAGAGLRNARIFAGSAGYESGGDPVDDAQRYAVLDGTAPQSLPPPDPQTGLRPPFEGHRDDDMRVIASGGPLGAVEPGASIDLAFAIVVGPGLAGVTHAAARAVLLYENDWRPEGPVSVVVQDFAAAATEHGVRLRWRLADRSELRAIRVTRGAAADGPWTELAVLAPAAAMEFLDRDPAQGDTWYRLVLERADGSLVAQPAVLAPAREVIGLALDAPEASADGDVVLRFALARDAALALDLVDVRGRCVATILRGPAAAGNHVRVWDGRTDAGVRPARGVYWLRLSADGATRVRRWVHAAR